MPPNVPGRNPRPDNEAPKRDRDHSVVDLLTIACHLDLTPAEFRKLVSGILMRHYRS